LAPLPLLNSTDVLSCGVSSYFNARILWLGYVNFNPKTHTCVCCNYTATYKSFACCNYISYNEFRHASLVPLYNSFKPASFGLPVYFLFVTGLVWDRVIY
jgi:hypothetical protein